MPDGIRPDSASWGGLSSSESTVGLDDRMSGFAPSADKLRRNGFPTSDSLEVIIRIQTLLGVSGFFNFSLASRALRCNRTLRILTAEWSLHLLV